MEADTAHHSNGRPGRALTLVKAFAEAYPPSRITRPTPKDSLRSTRTTLVGARPLVRFTSTTDVPDDAVPPLLTFMDLEVLHHKLVAAGHREGIAYLTWLCKAYKGALSRRREASIKAEPVDEGAVSQLRIQQKQD